MGDDASTDRYGGYDLQRKKVTTKKGEEALEDRDGDMKHKPTWGGEERSHGTASGLPGPCSVCPVAPSSGFNKAKHVNTLTLPQHVRQLQEDLRELGFLLVPKPDPKAEAKFDYKTEWGVREFQIYAKMDKVAVEDSASTATRYVDRLSAVPNAIKYSGPVSGVVNADTRKAIQHWLDNNWRCPVVIDPWAIDARGVPQTPRSEQNIWLHKEFTTGAWRDKTKKSEPWTGARMVATDFSDYYSTTRTGVKVVGHYAPWHSQGGPASTPPGDTWGEAEILPESLVGQPWSALTEAQRSTFKIIRAVSEVEPEGYFDGLTAYDNGYMSATVYHGTLGLLDGGKISEGELCGFLAYLAEADATAFEKAIQFFGARVNKSWGGDGKSLFVPGHRKYTGWMALQQEDGSFSPAIMTNQAGRNAGKEADYFRTWHWFYRFAMAGRAVEGYRRRMWHMGRVRIRDIRATPWGTGVANVGDSASARAAVIGDVVTSERFMGMVLRLHARGAGFVTYKSEATGNLHQALSKAKTAKPKLKWNTDPSTWGNDHELALIDAFSGVVQNSSNSVVKNSWDTVKHVRDWSAANAPHAGFALDATIGNLSADRDSFEFDDSDLPPAPY